MTTSIDPRTININKLTDTSSIENIKTRCIELNEKEKNDLIYSYQDDAMQIAKADYIKSQPARLAKCKKYIPDAKAYIESCEEITQSYITQVIHDDAMSRCKEVK